MNIIKPCFVVTVCGLLLANMAVAGVNPQTNAVRFLSKRPFSTAELQEKENLQWEAASLKVRDVSHANSAENHAQSLIERSNLKYMSKRPYTTSESESQ